MPPKKTGPKQKPIPSKEVLAMVRAVKAKKAIYRKREEVCHGNGPDYEPSDTEHVPTSRFVPIRAIPQVNE